MPPERHPDHEGLQVVPTDGLEHSGFTPGLEVATEEGLEYHAVKDVNNYPEVVPVPVPIEEKPASASTICGLKRRTFWIVLGIAVVAIILAAVLGGVLASKKSAGADSTPIPPTPAAPQIPSIPPPPAASRATASSSSASSATFTAQNAYPTTRLPLDCPAINSTTATVTADTTGLRYDFDIFCSANFGVNRDVALLNASSIDDCMQNCVDRIALGSACAGVVWDSVMNLKLNPRQNCFLKGSTAGFNIYDSKGYSSVGAVRGAVRVPA